MTANNNKYTKLVGGHGGRPQYWTRRGKIVIPGSATQLINEILEEGHEGHHHGGIHDLEDRTQHFYWKYKAESIYDHIHSCPACPIIRAPHHGGPAGGAAEADTVAPGALGVPLSLAPFERDGEGSEVGVGEALRVEEGVAVPVRVGDTVGVPDRDCDGVADPLGVAVAEMEGDSPAERDDVGEADSVELPLFVELGVSLPVGVGEGVSVPLTKGDCVELLLRDALPEVEGDAPRVSDAVPLVIAVELPLRVEESINAAVPVPVCVLEAVGVTVGDADGVAEPLREALAVADDNAPTVSDAVGEAVTVEVSDAVLLGVAAGVGVPVGVGEGESLPVAEGEGVALLLSNALPDMEGDAPRVSDGVRLSVAVELPLRVVEGVAEANRGRARGW